MKAAVVGLLAAAAVVAGALLSGAPGSPAAGMSAMTAMTGSTMTQPPANAPTPAGPLQPAAGGTGPASA
jgi:hypothetical protein